MTEGSPLHSSPLEQTQSRSDLGVFGIGFTLGFVRTLGSTLAGMRIVWEREREVSIIGPAG